MSDKNTISNIKIDGVSYSINDPTKAPIELVNNFGNLVTANNSSLTEVHTKLDELLTKVNNNSSGNDSITNNFNYVCVISYTPAYDKIESFEVSDLYFDDMNSGIDMSSANGLYQITPETVDKPYYERIYKHVSQNYFIYYVPESSDGSYYGYGWAINQSISFDTMSVLMYNSSMSELVEGTSNKWYGEMSMLSMPLTINNITKEHINQNIVCKKVIDYNEDTLRYIFDDQEFIIHNSEYTPEEHGIYVLHEMTLIGKSIGNEAGAHLRTYIPCHDTELVETLKDLRGHPYSTKVLKALKYPSMGLSYDSYHFPSQEIDRVSCLGATNTEAFMISTITDNNIIRYSYKCTAYPHDANRKWSMGFAFNSGNNYSKNQRLWFQNANIPRASLDILWTSSPYQIALKLDDDIVISYSTNDIALGWHYALLTYDYDLQKFTLYVNGVNRGEYTYSYERAQYFDACEFGIGKNTGGYYIGNVCEIKFWDIPLNSTQVEFEYQQFLNLIKI